MSHIQVAYDTVSKTIFNGTVNTAEVATEGFDLSSSAKIGQLSLELFCSEFTSGTAGLKAKIEYSNTADFAVIEATSTNAERFFSKLENLVLTGANQEKRVHISLDQIQYKYVRFYLEGLATPDLKVQVKVFVEAKHKGKHNAS